MGVLACRIPHVRVRARRDMFARACERMSHAVLVARVCDDRCVLVRVFNRARVVSCARTRARRAVHAPRTSYVRAWCDAHAHAQSACMLSLLVSARRMQVAGHTGEGATRRWGGAHRHLSESN